MKEETQKADAAAQAKKSLELKYADIKARLDKASKGESKYKDYLQECLFFLGEVAA